MIPSQAVPVSSLKIICLLSQINLPLSYMGLNLACIMQRFLHGGTILGRGAFPGGARESSRHRFPPLSLFVPTHPSGSKVGESSEECEFSDNVDYHQLLKDYREVQAVLSSTRLKAEMLHNELDAACDTLQASKNLAS